MQNLIFISKVQHVIQIENRIRKHVNENVIVVSANVNYPKCKRDYSWNPSTLFVRIASISKVLQAL